MEVKRDNHFTYHALSDKERKNLAVLDLIRKKGPLSRTDISHITDINIVSISNYINNYLEHQLVVETGLENSTGGRRAELIELNKKSVIAVGIEVGINQLHISVLDCALHTLGEQCVTYSADTPEAGAQEICAAVKAFVDSLKISHDTIRVIGIGVAQAHLAPMALRIRECSPWGSFIGNNAACAAYGEKTLNAAAGVEDLLYMHSDIGCGIVIRGDIYCGANGSAGEMRVSHDHISKEENIVLSRESQYLRPWGAGLGVAEAARREIEKGVGTTMVSLAHGDVRNVTADVVIAAAQQGDEIARDIIHSTALNLGIRIAYLVNLFNPAAVVIGGGMEKAGELILEPIRKTVKKFALSEQGNTVVIIPSGLGEYAVARGAASLAIRELFLRA